MAARVLDEYRRVAQESQHCPLPEELPVLTAREKQVLACVTHGATDKEIADELSVSLSTVKTHVRNILAKLNATSRHQAAAYATREGLIRSPDLGGSPTKE